MKVCWNLTNICNEDCIYCFRELIEKPRELTDNIKIINKLRNLGVDAITFAGGEPLLYPDIITLLEYSKYLGITNKLVTNGTKLNETSIHDILPYVDKLAFSVDSPSQYVNEESGRGKNHYQHIKEVLPYIKANFPHLPIEINSVTTRINYQEVEFMFDTLSSELTKYGIKRWKIIRFSSLRGYAKAREQLLSLSDETFINIKDKFDGQNALFDITVRGLEAIDERIVVSPCGSLKKAVNSQEKVLVQDLLTTPERVIKKELVRGGTHV